MFRVSEKKITGQYIGILDFKITKYHCWYKNSMWVSSIVQWNPRRPKNISTQTSQWLRKKKIQVLEYRNLNPDVNTTCSGAVQSRHPRRNDGQKDFAGGMIQKSSFIIVQVSEATKDNIRWRRMEELLD